MRKMDMREIKPAPVEGRMDGILNTDPSMLQLKRFVNVSLLSDLNVAKLLVHAATWVLAVIFAGIGFGIATKEFTTESDPMQLPSWYVAYSTLAFVFLLVGFGVLLIAGFLWNEPYRRPLSVSAVLGLLTTSTLLYTSLLPTTAVYVNNSTGTYAFSAAEVEDLGKLRDYTLVLVLCGAFGISQVVAYLIFTTKA